MTAESRLKGGSGFGGEIVPVKSVNTHHIDLFASLKTAMASAEVLECPVCREFYDDQNLCPRLLSCGHTFCSSCLEQLLNNNAITCPTCRGTIPVTTGVAGLTKNYALLNLGNTTPQPAEGVHNCEVCDVKHPATSWCLDCDYDMCKIADRFHTRNKASCDHKVVSLEQLAVSVFCSKHNEQFRLFDEECDHMVCRSCVNLTHKNHSLLSLAEVGSRCKQEMEDLAAQASAQAEVIKAAETRVLNVSRDMKTACEEQRAKIQSVFKKLHDAVTTREQDLMNELEKLHNKKAAILTEQQALLRVCQECIEATVQGVLSTVQSSDNAKLLYVRCAIESTLAAATENQYLVLEPEAHCLPEFTRFDERRFQRVVDALNKVGIVIDKSTCAETTTAADSGLERANPGEAASFTITARDAQSHTRTEGGDTFLVELKNELGEQVGANVEDEENGSYLATYTIPAGAKRVDYTLSVRLRGAHIQGSPFTVHLASPLRRKTNKVLSDVVSKITLH